jgi:hypothetical protein
VFPLFANVQTLHVKLYSTQADFARCRLKISGFLPEISPHPCGLSSRNPLIDNGSLCARCADHTSGAPGDPRTPEVGMSIAPDTHVRYPYLTAARITVAEKRHLDHLCQVSGQSPSAVLRQLINEKRLKEIATDATGLGEQEPVA